MVIYRWSGVGNNKKIVKEKWKLLEGTDESKDAATENKQTNKQEVFIWELRTDIEKIY